MSRDERPASRVEALKFLPVRLGMTRLPVGWRLLLSILVMAAYMAASRIIYNSEGLSFAEVELLRTPFRLGAALLFWLLMADVMFARRPDVSSLRSPSFALGICIAFLVSLLILADQGGTPAAFVVAVASFPVALCEEFFFRGILQTMLVRYIGALQGVILTTGLFVVFHVGVGPPDALRYVFIALAGLVLGLVYFRSGSMMSVVAIHATYDALASVLEAPILSRLWGLALLLCATALVTKWASART